MKDGIVSILFVIDLVELARRIYLGSKPLQLLMANALYNVNVNTTTMSENRIDVGTKTCKNTTNFVTKIPKT